MIDKKTFYWFETSVFFVVEQMLLILSLVLACLNHVFVLHVIVHQCRLVRRIRLLNDVMKLFLSFHSSIFSDVKKDDVIDTGKELHQLIDQSNSLCLHFEIH